MSKKDLIKYRSVWMGIAIIWIVFYHYSLCPDIAFIREIINNGYGGVDIFVFASGLGCYYSLKKESDSYMFLKKRFFKIMPMYWAMMLVWCTYYCFKGELTWRQIFGNLLCVQSITEQGGDFNWYINAIWIYYFLAPFLKGLADRADKLVKTIIIIVILVLFSIPFWNVKNHIIIITRIPLFFIGMCFAKVPDSYYLSEKIIWLSIIPIGLGVSLLSLFFKFFSEIMWSYGLFWYPFILIAPAMCLLISFFSQYIDKTKFGRRLIQCFSSLGEHSLQIYLVHEFIRCVLLDYNVLNLSYYPLMLLGLLLIIPVSFAVKIIGNKFKECFLNFSIRR